MKLTIPELIAHLQKMPADAYAVAVSITSDPTMIYPDGSNDSEMVIELEVRRPVVAWRDKPYKHLAF